MKKIVFISDSLGGGGAERVTVELADAFASIYGYEIHILTFTESAQDYDIPQCITIHNMELHSEEKLKSLRKCIWMRKEINKIGASYVISLALPKTSVILTAISLIRPYILILSERNDPGCFPKNKLLRILRKIAYKVCDGIVFQTCEAQSFFSKRIQNKSCVIPNPISKELPDRYMGDREKRIINFCRMAPQKNLPLLINAFAKISDEYPEYILDIYGEGPQRDTLNKMIKQLKLEKRIFLHRYSTNIHAEVRKCSLYVSSSDYEGISNSMLEALVMGIPTICTDCPAGGARMMIQNGVNGILVPVNDVAALSGAMRTVLADKQLMSSISINASKLRKSLSIDTISQKWMKYIEKLDFQHKNGLFYN